MGTVGKSKQSSKTYLVQEPTSQTFFSLSSISWVVCHRRTLPLTFESETRNAATLWTALDLTANVRLG